jgi:hypothetical protein
MRTWCFGALVFACLGAFACGSDKMPGDPTGQGGSTSSSSGAAGAGGAGGMASTSSAGGGGAAPVGRCVKGCAAPADCCPMGAPNCPSGTYPTNYTCDQGICGPPQCAVKDECTAGGALPDYDCSKVGGFATCLLPAPATRNVGRRNARASTTRAASTARPRARAAGARRTRAAMASANAWAALASATWTPIARAHSGTSA